MPTHQADIPKYIEWLKSGRPSSDVRKDLLIRGFPEAETSEVVRSLDELMMGINEFEFVQARGTHFKIAGVLSILIGVMLIGLSVMYSVRSMIVVLPVGFIATGLGLVAYGKRLQRGSAPTMVRRYGRTRFGRPR